MADEVERQELLARLERLKAMGEKEYDDMYEAHSPSGATACYSGAKDAFYDAIGLAKRLGLDDEAETLYKRLSTSRRCFGASLPRAYVGHFCCSPPSPQRRAAQGAPR